MTTKELSTNSGVCALGLALSLLLAAPAPAAAQSAAASGSQAAGAGGNWSAVGSVAPGTKLVVRMKSGERVIGRFESASDLVLVLAREGRTEALARDRIMNVSLRRDKSRRNGALLGAGIGGGIGLGTGGYLYSLGDFTGTTVPGLGIIGAGIGAGIGAAVGKGRKNVPIYEAQ